VGIFIVLRFAYIVCRPSSVFRPPSVLRLLFSVFCPPSRHGSTELAEVRWVNLCPPSLRLRSGQASVSPEAGKILSSVPSTSLRAGFCSPSSALCLLSSDYEYQASIRLLIYPKSSSQKNPPKTSQNTLIFVNFCLKRAHF